MTTLAVMDTILECGTAGAAVFYLSAAVTLAAALAAVICQDRIRSIIFAAVSAAGAAGMCVCLGNPLITALQLVMFAAAGSVLLMFVNRSIPAGAVFSAEPAKINRIASAAVCLILFLIISSAVLTSGICSDYQIYESGKVKSAYLYSEDLRINSSEAAGDSSALSFRLSGHYAFASGLAATALLAVCIGAAGLLRRRKMLGIQGAGRQNIFEKSASGKNGADVLSAVKAKENNDRPDTDEAEQQTADTPEKQEEK